MCVLQANITHLAGTGRWAAMKRRRRSVEKGGTCAWGRMRRVERVNQFQRVAGALVGLAVGDAPGGPFEFGPQAAFSPRFPAPGASG